MKFNIKGFITSKNQESYSDCADNYAFNIGNNRFAISDGVSISFFSEIWSKILTHRFVENKNSLDAKFLTDCQKEWHKNIIEIIKKPDVKWFVKAKYNKKEFAAATFIGLQFLEEENKWIVQSIGDSFLFFVPKNCTDYDQIITYPNEKGFVFDNYPNYFASIENNHRGKRHVSTKKSLEEGTFFLMTDAIAEWFVKELKENVENAVNLLVNIENQEHFLEVVQSKRSDNSLKNDDTTILIIEVADDEQPEFNYSIENFSYLDQLIEEQSFENQQIN